MNNPVFQILITVHPDDNGFYASVAGLRAASPQATPPRKLSPMSAMLRLPSSAPPSATEILSRSALCPLEKPFQTPSAAPSPSHLCDTKQAPARVPHYRVFRPLCPFHGGLVSSSPFVTVCVIL